MSRCVRRAFLCGDDAHAGRNYDHRRGWILERVKQLAGVFAIDVAAYAVMSNHYHLVLRVDAERARGGSRDEVLRRWTRLVDGPLAVQRLLAGKGEELDKATQPAIDEWAEKYRARLGDLSWFMRVLNESIARKANAEDQVTGHCSEGRFKSQALLEEQAVPTAMAYVDLNPIRAQMAQTPEASDHTSVSERIAHLKPASAQKPQTTPTANPTQNAHPAPPPAIPIVALKGEAHLAELPLQRNR